MRRRGCLQLSLLPSPFTPRHGQRLREDGPHGGERPVVRIATHSVCVRVPFPIFCRLHLDTAPDEYSLSEANLGSGREYPSTMNDRAESRPKSFYRNPFREIDMSSFPAELRQRLQELPVPTQIAILRDAKLQQKFFPEYCHPV